MSITFDPASPTRRGRGAALALAVLSALGLVGVVVGSILNKPKPESGDLYFTTFAHQALWAVAFDYSGSHPVFGARRIVTKLPGADGVGFEPDGKAVIGSQNSDVLEVDPGSGAVTKVPSGCPAAFHITLSPSGNTVYTAALPGQLCALPTDPLEPGHPITLRGDDTEVTSVAFDQTGRCWYTTGDVPGSGNFGTLDLTTGTTTRKLSGLPNAHGMTFDPYTKTLFVFGGTGIIQINPGDPQKIVSSMTVPGVQFDNGTTDGRGHLFVASNFGQLVVVDYHVSGVVGDTRNVVTDLHLENNLDDVAPLVGPGAASPAVSHFVEYGAIGFGILLFLALLYRYGPSAQLTSRLPTWDIRRQELEARRRNARRISRREKESKPPRGPGW
jgi:hypothetical protein